MSEQFNYAEAIKWLDAHVNWEIAAAKPGDKQFLENPQSRMDRLEKMLALMGDPHRVFPSIHLTGTNGKTSTTRMIAALVEAQGLRTGTYTSPHLERINERITNNLDPIEDDELAEVLYAVSLIEPMLEGPISFFEIMTAAAFRHFADAPVNVAVVEVGVGGRWDATNIIDGAVSVITNIGLDHANYLGPTRADVADKKADIIKPGCAAVIGERDPQFLSLWESKGPKALALIDRDFGVESNQFAVGGRLLTLKTPSARYEDVFLSLHGTFQGENAAIALTAAEAFFEQPLSEEVVSSAFESVRSPGRVEVVHRQPLVVIDGAHNEAGARALSETLDEEFAAVTGRILVMGVLNGHDPKELLAAMGPDKVRLIVATAPESPRAIPASQVAEAAKALKVEVVEIEGIANAVDFAMNEAEDEELVVVAGSLYTVGAARHHLLSK